MRYGKNRKNGKTTRNLPLADLFPAGETVVLYGDRRMTVQGCRKILAYSPAQIVLQLKCRQLCVSGKDLGCSSFSGGCTTLQGRIESVTYSQGKKEGGK